MMNRINFLTITAVFFSTLPVGQVSCSDRPILGDYYNAARISNSNNNNNVNSNNNTHHMAPRALITTLTIVFGVFGAILLVALAVLFVHFFVIDLSDYILCCFQKNHHHGRTALSTSSLSTFRFCRCLLPYAVRCRHETVASGPRSARVYRPAHLVAATSSPSLPACLNFRRRTDPSFLFGDETGIVYSSPNHRPAAVNTRRSNNQSAGIYSISSISSSTSSSHLVTSSATPLSNRRLSSNNRRHSFLSSFYANSMFSPEEIGSNRAGMLVSSHPNIIAAYQLPQPPSYDDAVMSSSSSCANRRQNNQQLPRNSASSAAELALSLFTWSQLPPPPAYDEVVITSVHRPSCSNNETIINQFGQLPSYDSAVDSPSSSSSNAQGEQGEQIINSSVQQQSSAPASSTNSAGSIVVPPVITTCSAAAAAATGTPTVLSSSSANYAFTNQTYLANNSNSLNNGVSFNDYKPIRSQRGCRLIMASNSGQISGNSSGVSSTAVSADDSSTPTVYDVTHVYSWHI